MAAVLARTPLARQAPSGVRQGRATSFWRSEGPTGVMLGEAVNLDLAHAVSNLPASGVYSRAGLPNILGARRVSDTFHARFSALSRTYVYRVVTGCSCPSELPVFERNLCWVTQRGHLDLTAMQEAAGFLVGTHDFSTFRSASSELFAKNPVKTIDQLEIRPSSGFLMHHVKSSELKFWELEFTSRSFLYKQVRRMAGVLVAVGQHRLDPEHVKKLLEIRDLMAYPQSTIAPACGLFLKNVEYCEADLETGRSEAET